MINGEAMISKKLKTLVHIKTDENLKILGASFVIEIMDNFTYNKLAAPLMFDNLRY